MSDLPRLNGVIRTLEQGQTTFVSFAAPEISAAVAFGESRYDGIVFDSEHVPWDIRTLRDCLQYLLNRKQILTLGSVAPAVTPLFRIPPNGAEMSQVFAKQILDVGAYGIVWPHIDNVEQAYNAVAACRYARPKSHPLYEPAGIRGDGPTAALRYWGITQQEYYRKADVWPLNPEGEILVVLMIEGTTGIANLPDILANVPGIGVILIGEGDLSQELGHPRDYEHPEVVSAMREIVDICKRFGVPVGHPHVDSRNVERVLNEGFRFLMAAPQTSYAPLEQGMRLSGRLS